MLTKFYVANLWIVALILAPNLLMFFCPPANTPTHTAASGLMWTAVGVVEWIGRALGHIPESLRQLAITTTLPH